ncbi:Type-1 restriction enzyme EcoKI specificity protein [Myxococcaceae bacterium]|nr:Type-1 restriction enzyme EcoKI specificity protein [Myxococcaceae bacterium]
MSFIPMAAVHAGSGTMNPTETRLWREARRGYVRFQEGDVLFAKITPCMENGKVATARGLSCGVGTGSTEFHVLRSRQGVDSGFIMHLLLQERVRQDARRHMTGSAGQLRVPSAFLESLPTAVPPAFEQRRIVAALEQQLSRIEAGVAALERAKANLERYRASVLKAACEGRLVPTEAELARAEGRTYEPASELLARILKERRERWEADQLARMKARGKPPKDDAWKKKYPEPAAPDTSALPELPEGWCWATVEQGAIRVEYGTSARTAADAGNVPVLRMGNIVNGLLDLRSLKFLPGDHAEFPGLHLEEGDLLFNRTNSPELVGKSAVYHGQPNPCSFASYLIRVRTVPGLSTEFLCFVLNSPYGRAWIASAVSQQVGQANVNGSKLQALAFPLPPATEQARIVAEIDRRVSMGTRLEADLGALLLRASRLRQSLLAHAFSGKLVPQDPTDEPASVLLERIRKEREAAAAEKPKQPARRGSPQRGPRKTAPKGPR